jgi:hypothetical protein
MTRTLENRVTAGLYTRVTQIHEVAAASVDSFPKIRFGPNWK